ncbi:MAG TPA: VWA domain-containing protein [Pyrinomonadaceae bacterium]|nr:VWA domain-containing protein [Pyrinomonadaceae bacterium]
MANSEVFVITRSLLRVRCLVTAFRWRAWLQGGGNPGELGGARTKSGDRRPRRGNRAEVPVAPHSKVLLGCLALILLLGFASAPAHAQTSKDPQKSQDDDEVVRVKSNLVNIDVMVKDKKGKYISDLRAEDFTIFENGVQQKVEFFDAPLAGTDGRSKPGGALQPELSASGSARNYVSLVLDSQTTDITNLKQVREGTIKYVREQITEADTVALFSVTSGLQLLQPFTQDKAKLISALENVGVNSSSKNFEQRDIAGNIGSLRDQLSSSPSTPTTSITTTAGGSEAAKAMIASRVLQQFIKLRTALSLQQSRPILAALAAICEGLRPIPGKKTLVLFSQGFVTPAVLDWQVQSTIDIANRANVAIYIIDSAGLRAGAPRSGSLVPASPLAGVSAITNQEQRIRAVGGETVFDNTRQEGESREYDILYRISGDTGGRFLKGNNDIGQGLERINQEIQSRYTLAYRSTNQNFDSTFRKVKIEVRRPEAQIISRSGYYAIPPEEIVLLSPEDKKLLTNFAAAETNPGLPIFVELSSFRSREGLYTVPLSIELPPAAVQFNRKGDKRSMQLEVLGVIRATPEKVLSRVGGNFDVSLSAEQYESILNNNIFYRQDLQLLPGDYSLDLIVRDRLSGKITAKREKLVLPEVDSEFATTAVVLSRYVEPSDQQPAGFAEGDVFTHGKAKIRPSPSRQFQATDNLIMFFEVYNGAKSAETSRPLVRVTVRLMKDGKPATKPFDYVLTETQTEPVPHLTFAEYISLRGLPAGTYTALIEAKDMVTRKLVKQEASFVIWQ